MGWPNEMFLKGFVVGLVCLPLIFVACEYVSRRLDDLPFEQLESLLHGCGFSNVVETDKRPAR